MKSSKAAAWFFGAGTVIKIGVVIAMALAAKTAIEPAVERALPVAVTIVSPLPTPFARVDPGSGKRYAAWALAVPESSVYHDRNSAFVYTVDGDGVAHLQRIDTGDRRDGLVEVAWGLSFDAHVIQNARGRINDGELVRVEPAPGTELANATDETPT